MDNNKEITIRNLIDFGNFISSEDSLMGAWLQCIADALVFEELYPKEVKEAGKDIWDNLDGFINLECDPNPYIEDIIKWGLRTYDRFHPLRNNVETLDSIEVIRQLKLAVFVVQIFGEKVRFFTSDWLSMECAPKDEKIEIIVISNSGDTHFVSWDEEEEAWVSPDSLDVEYDIYRVAYETFELKGWLPKEFLP